MTAPSIREALEAALKYYDSLEREHAPGEAELLDRIQATLAAPPQDVVEGIARIIDPKAFDQKLHASAGWRSSWITTRQSDAFAKAETILATGLVPDEASIRADERERCAKVAETPDCWKSFAGDFEGNCIAAAIRSGGGE